MLDLEWVETAHFGLFYWRIKKVSQNECNHKPTKPRGKARRKHNRMIRKYGYMHYNGYSMAMCNAPDFSELKRVLREDGFEDDNE